MQFSVSAQFQSDVKRLKKLRQRDAFVAVVRSKFIPAAEAFIREPGQGWPPGLRVKSVVETPGVWEMTWSKSNPDGRATFEWIRIDGKPAIRWRRVGDHSIFSKA